jgi:hypothetical protein
MLQAGASACENLMSKWVGEDVTCDQGNRFLNELFLRSRWRKTEFIGWEGGVT